MSDNKVSALFAVGVALTLAMGCSAGVKPTNTGGSGPPGTDAGVDRPSVVGGPADHDRPRRAAGAARREPAAPAASRPAHLHARGRPLLQHHRQRLPGSEAGLRRLYRRQHLQRRRDGARHLSGRRELHGADLRLGRPAKYCGKIGDGCGRELDCGMCAAARPAAAACACRRTARR